MYLLWYANAILNKISEGGFGSVYLCFNKKKNRSNLFAIKCIKSSESINSADREWRFGYVFKLNSEYLVKYFEIFISNNDLYVAMEYFKNGKYKMIAKKITKQ
jgi:serine/threonine protein kinase